jgi:hypothetical protein
VGGYYKIGDNHLITKRGCLKWDEKLEEIGNKGFVKI